MDRGAEDPIIYKLNLFYTSTSLIVAEPCSKNHIQVWKRVSQKPFSTVQSLQMTLKDVKEKASIKNCFFFSLFPKLQPKENFLRRNLLCPLEYPIWLVIYNLGHHKYTIAALL